MKDRFDNSNGRTISDFRDVSPFHHDAIHDMVRHLARISAQNDYNDFLKLHKMRYNPDSRKGPGS
jgi:hypothetical protein